MKLYVHEFGFRERKFYNSMANCHDNVFSTDFSRRKLPCIMRPSYDTSRVNDMSRCASSPRPLTAASSFAGLQA